MCQINGDLTGIYASQSTSMANRIARASRISLPTSFAAKPVVLKANTNVVAQPMSTPLSLWEGPPKNSRRVAQGSIASTHILTRYDQVPTINAILYHIMAFFLALAVVPSWHRRARRYCASTRPAFAATVLRRDRLLLLSRKVTWPSPTE